jgi:ATP-dependent Lhr-like helicase
MPLDFLHPAVRAWFDQSFAAPTPAQSESWPAVKAGHDDPVTGCQTGA